MIWWFIILLIVCVATAAMYLKFLPKYFLKFRYNIPNPSGRGLKFIQNENGKDIIYVPDRKIEPYIKGYILSEKKGKKFFICKVDDEIGYLDYDIVLYNSKRNVFKSLRIKESVNRNVLREVELPEKTCYISILLNEVDGKKINNDGLRKVNKGLLLIFITLCAIIEILGFMTLRLCLAEFFGGIFSESFLASDSEQIYFVFISAVIILLNLLFTLVAVKIKNRK